MSCISSFGQLPLVRRGQQLEDVSDPDSEIAEASILRAQVRELYVHLATLPPRERQVIGWRAGLAGGPELSVRAIAKRLGCSVGHVHALEKRGMAHLSAAYGLAPSPTGSACGAVDSTRPEAATRHAA